MKTSEKGKSFIKGFESCKLKAYKCPANIPTIGYGHTEGVEMGMIITQDEADALFDKDILRFDLDLARYVGNVTKQHQWDALISFAFNLGLGALKNSTLYKKLKINPDDPTIPSEFKKWCKARVNGELVSLPGLVRRRNAEALMYEQNLYT